MKMRLIPRGFIFLLMISIGIGQVASQSNSCNTDITLALEEADTAFLNSRHEDSIALYECVLTVDPENTRAVFGVLQNYGSLAETDQAINFLLDRVQEYPDLPIHYVFLGLFHMPDRNEEAVQVFSELAEDYPENAIVFAELGFAYEQIGQTDLAEENLNIAVSLNPDVGLNYITTEDGFQLTVNDPVAATLVNRAYRLSPDTFEVMVAKGISLNVSGEYAEAIPVLEQALEQQADDAQVLFNLAVAHDLTDNDEEALDLYLRVIELEPTDYPSHIAIGGIYIRDRNLDEAIEYLERGAELEPDEAFHYALLGLAYEVTGQIEKAIANYQLHLELAGDEPVDFVQDNLDDLLRDIDDE
jgi:tetratricopeptide (TPR) repeat protein